MKNQKRVYSFGNGKAEGRADMRNELGGKGANLAEMNLIGVPVPPGFTITTDVCNEYYEIGKDNVVALLKEEVEKSLHLVEELMNSKFGDIENPPFTFSTPLGLGTGFRMHPSLAMKIQPLPSGFRNKIRSCRRRKDDGKTPLPSQ